MLRPVVMPHNRWMQFTGTTNAPSATASVETGNKLSATLGCRIRSTLAPQPKGFDDGTVALNIVALDIIKQPATLAHQHQQPSAGVVVFFVHFQMLGQIGNPM